MAFKDILVALTSYPEPTPVSAVDGAVSVAAALGAHIAALSCEVHVQVPGHFISGAVVGLPGVMAAEAGKSRKNAQDLLAAFEASAVKSGVSRQSILQRCKSFEVPDLLVEYARLRDLTIMPESNDRWYAEAVIFGTGRPTLILPQHSQSRRFEFGTIAVAWDFSRAAARALSDAMPLLERARRVRVVTVVNEKALDRKHSAEELSKSLSRHGIDVVLDRVDAGGRRIGDVLGAYVAEHAADMLVMGAYGHSRLREFVLGGATKSLLSKPPLPNPAFALMADIPPIEGAVPLRRRLGLGLLVLYGTGITVGAGIYVLIGAVAGHAGIYAPWSFVIAGAVMALTVASYAELSTRYPVSAGEAAYVRAAFQSRALSTAVGLLSVVTGVVSSAAVTLGSAGYIRQFIDLPQGLIVMAVVVALGAVAAWGILESVLLASLFTVIEVGGLVTIIVAGFHAGLPIAATIAHPPPLDAMVWSGVGFGGLLAFFAFIGFEDLANVVEEAKLPNRDIPRAMILTLAISTVLYVLVAAVAVSAGPIERLASSSAPLSLVFREVAGVSAATISAIAIVSTLNTILAQMTMAARVLYGLAREGELPLLFARVHARTGTPLIATACVAAAVVPLALLVPLTPLAEGTSLATLALFALVNLALLRLRYRGVRSDTPHVRVPIWIPLAGLVTCVAMMTGALFG